MASDKPVEALAAYERSLQWIPQRTPSILGLAKAASAAGDKETAEEMISTLPEALLQTEAVLPAETLLQTETGITRMRGKWAEVEGVPALPMFHPAYLLRTPIQKRAAWADLLALKQKLTGA